MNTKELLKKYSKPENFINRDLSWVEFNKRVLDEALNPELPLLDKIKFISIFCSNLDEFYITNWKCRDETAELHLNTDF